MKKILFSFLTSFFIIFISTNTYASEWYIENLLDLNIWIEEYDLELSYIDKIYFINSNTKEIFDNFKVANRLLKDEIIKKYRAWEFDYYQVKWIITNQKMFVFHINRLSHYLSIKEQNHRYLDVDNFILKNYSNARIYYKRVKYLVNK